jgi:hypothetical protein
MYALKRDALLMRHPWKFAARSWYSDYEDQLQTITNATKADPVVVTIANHPFQVGQYVLIDDVAGMTELNTETLRITAIATNTITLGDVDGSAYTAYSSGGTARLRPPFEFEYGHILPADFLYDVGLYDSDSAYLVKDGALYTNDDEINLEYIAQVTDVGRMNPMFIEGLAHFMAIDLAKRVADSRKWSEHAWKSFISVIRDAMQRDGFLGKPDTERPSSDWQEAGR